MITATKEHFKCLDNSFLHKKELSSVKSEDLDYSVSAMHRHKRDIIKWSAPENKLKTQPAIHTND